MFLVHFVRLGVLNRINDISESFDKEELDIGEGLERSANRVCIVVIIIIIYLIIESNGSLTYGPHGSSETPRAMFKN